MIPAGRQDNFQFHPCQVYESRPTTYYCPNLPPQSQAILRIYADQGGGSEHCLWNIFWFEVSLKTLKPAAA